MMLTYDRNHNVAYLRLRPKGAEVETIRINSCSSARPTGGRLPFRSRRPRSAH
jgi:hypothetical protein